MWPRISIVLGLLAGVAVAALVIGGLLFLGPAPVLVPPATPAPTVPATASPSPPPTASPSPSVIPSASPVVPSPPPSGSSASPSGSPSPSVIPSASPSGSSPSPSTLPVADLFHIGEVVPALVVEKIDGGKVLPGVTVTP
jgi:hypothetical protein